MLARRLYSLAVSILAIVAVAACRREEVTDDRATSDASATNREATRQAGAPADSNRRDLSRSPSLAPGPSGNPRSRPTMPRIIEGFCFGESCSTDFPARACRSVELRAAQVHTAVVVARVARGDTVKVHGRNLHVLEPGLVVMQRDFALGWDTDSDMDPFPRTDTLHFAAGDTIYLLHYLALGSWAWWHRGKEETGGAFWSGPPDGELGGASHATDSSTAVALSHPRTADWWQVETRSGSTGWWRADTLGSLVNMWKDGCWER